MLGDCKIDWDSGHVIKVKTPSYPWEINTDTGDDDDARGYSTGGTEYQLVLTLEEYEE